jgi:hypothetical protein
MVLQDISKPSDNYAKVDGASPEELRRRVKRHRGNTVVVHFQSGRHTIRER